MSIDQPPSSDQDAPTSDATGVDPAATVRALLARAADRLAAGGARDEALAEYVAARKVLGFTRPPVLRPVTRGWRLGALLLGRDRTLYATGVIIRAGEAGVRNYQSQSAEDRRDLRAAALRGKFAPGETVNHGWAVLDTDALTRPTTTTITSADVVFLASDGTVRVRWNAALGDGASRELGAYLDERVGLLVDPPDIP